ncbi:DNA mismatch repair protein MLH1 [Capsaspora owczarzaki ATCC 30864]|uniref:DNA mismatch repair protein MLH1 n=1 Tax=Capsaspora owczarzaki (strain ATCC 30864) TaxID=595528 RepID=UPI000352243B|nr:DNA mismatch repair protein MLH1 [Capsaspora owczarzaki ATCC 30864]|eukprot:XP_004345130.2 DNA mismatch repair protein MLH1 [Capsaspora owczarzaki ATCC 30864]
MELAETGDQQQHPLPAASVAAPPTPSPARRIRMLDPGVVNRIAAGEVIQRPFNALKELMENSLDAGATSIVMSVKAGGMKLMQIADNGSGIHLDDLDLVCERHTTSKLERFDDLKSIATFGFRGEALASVTRVAHVSIISKTADAKCAYKAHYADEKLVPPTASDTNARPRPCAGNKGTIITVEDLFYNISTRRKALKSPAEEHAKIVDVVGKYAIHNSGVSFTLKKHGETTAADVRTAAGGTRIDAVRAIYGAQVARELLELDGTEPKLDLVVKGLVSNADYSMPRGTFIFFINHRLVDCPSIRKAIETVYAAYLPKKTFPFVYLSLLMPGQNVDVNIHPTKKEVHFLHEDVVVETVQKMLEAKLLGSNASRTFYTQALLPGAIAPATLAAASSSSSSHALSSSASSLLAGASGSSSSSSAQASAAARSYAHQLVRTDNRMQTLDAFMAPAPRMPPNRVTLLSTAGTTSSSAPAPSGLFSSSAAAPARQQPSIQSFLAPIAQPEGDHALVTEDAEEEEVAASASASDHISITSSSAASVEPSSLAAASTPVAAESAAGTVTTLTKKKLLNIRRRPVHLTSVRNLLSHVEQTSTEGLVQMFQRHSFVGCVKPTLSLMQYSTNLYLVNVAKLSWHLFYQIVLREFSNFGTIRLNPSPLLYDVLMLALDDPESGWSPEDGDKDELATFMVSFFSERAEMLQDYFSIQVDGEGRLVTIPALLDDFVPELDRIPLFFLRLATEVNWDEEEACFEGVARLIAALFAVQPAANPLADEIPEDLHSNSDIAMSHARWQWTVEHVLFPAFRTMYPPAGFASDGTILQIANLTDLYKVFERC